MPRITMAEIIIEVRRLANAGTADFVIGAVTYFSDDHIQDILDRGVRDFRRMALSPLLNYANSASTYTDYIIPLDKFDWRIEREGAGGGFSLRNSNGGVAPSYTINWAASRIVFDVDTGGDTFYMDCRAYDFYMAVAEIYDAKAAAAAALVDWSSDNHDIKASQTHAHYLAEAQRYRLMSGKLVRMSTRVRTDERS